MRFESDDEFRARLYYVTGDRKVFNLTELELDVYAMMFQLQRRLIKLPGGGFIGI
jgi:hypothetical protein